MDVMIKEVTSLKDLKAFIRFPFSLYSGSPYWIPPLNFDELNTLRRDKNPAFDYCQAKYWLAYDHGRIVGRVAGILNQSHVEKWGQRYVRFGWLDFIDDPAVSAALLKTVEEWAAEVGMTGVHGPLGFTDLDREGMLVEGFNELGTFATYYNHPYYPLHLEKLGYVKDMDWVEYELVMPSEPPETIARAASIVLKRYNLRILEFRSKKELFEYAPQFFELMNAEYEHLYGTVALTKRQVVSYVKQYFDFIAPDFAPTVVDASNRIVGFGLALPSLSHALQKAQGELFPFGFIHLLRALKKNDRADLCVVAVKSEYQGRAVNAVLMNKMFPVFQKLGVKKIETNPEMETNELVQAQWKLFEKRQHKRRRCFIKLLS